MEVDKDLLPMKAHYFFFNAGTAPVVPFIPTLAKQLGFSSTVVGIMLSVLSMIGMCTKPLLGYICDRYQRHRFVFISTEVLTAFAFLMIMWTPNPQRQSIDLEIHCHGGITQLRYNSASTENCLAEKVTQRFQQRIISCDLVCEMDSELWQIVCRHWRFDNGTINNITVCKDYSSIKKNNNSKGNEMKLKRTQNYSNNTINSTHQMEEPLRLSLQLNTDFVKEELIMFFSVPHSHAKLNGEYPAIMYCPAADKDDERYFKSKCELECNSEEPLHNYLVNDAIINDNEVMGLYQFWWFFIMLALSWIGMAAVVTIGDALCFTVLADKSHLYGKQRLFGSIGWGLFSILSGLLIDAMSDGLHVNYSIVFWMSSAILILDVLASMKIKTKQTYLSSNIMKDIGRLCASWQCCLFFTWCIFIGIGTALVWNWLFWHLELLGGSCKESMKTLQGFVLAVQCFFGEIPFFFFSGWILKKLGHIAVMNLILLGFGVRFLLYSALVNPWYVLPIELLNGVTFGLFYATMTSYASIVAPPGTESTIQGLAGAIFEGIGVSVGSTIAGYLFDSIGGSSTFEVFGIGAFIVFIVHITILECFNNKWRTNQCLQNTITDENGVVEYFVSSEDMSILSDEDLGIQQRHSPRLL